MPVCTHVELYVLVRLSYVWYPRFLVLLMKEDIEWDTPVLRSI
jgi:hypothetical protein